MRQVEALAVAARACGTSGAISNVTLVFFRAEELDTRPSHLSQDAGPAGARLSEPEMPAL
jgi:hypothetical protein